MKILPITKLGQWSVGLTAIFFLLIGSVMVLVNVFHQGGGNTFFDNYFISIPMLFAVLSAIAASVTGIVSVRKYKERSLLVAIPISIGLMLVVFLLGEFIAPH